VLLPPSTRSTNIRCRGAEATPEHYLETGQLSRTFHGQTGYQQCFRCSEHKPPIGSSLKTSRTSLSETYRTGGTTIIPCVRYAKKIVGMAMYLNEAALSLSDAASKTSQAISASGG
jgi:hypothetical protein